MYSHVHIQIQRKYIQKAPLRILTPVPTPIPMLITYIPVPIPDHEHLQIRIHMQIHVHLHEHIHIYIYICLYMYIQQKNILIYPCAGAITNYGELRLTRRREACEQHKKTLPPRELPWPPVLGGPGRSEMSSV